MSSASGWAYAIVFALCVLDAFVPVVPAETAVITAGVVAAGGDLALALVIVVAAAGAFAGDNVSYGIGRTLGGRVVERFFRGDKARHRLDWAQGQLQERGVVLIVVGRFIPGGRTAVTIGAGLLRYRWARFAWADAAATLGWASYASLLGYFGGRAFEDAPWKGLVLALGIGFAVAVLVEGGRRLRQRLS